MRVSLGLSLSLAAAAVALPGTAHAFSFYQFQSPSGNIFCGVGTLDNGKAFAECDILDRLWSPPPVPCVEGRGDRISLDQGRPAVFECRSDTLFGENLPTLDYGKSYSDGPITCSSEQSGITCKDTGTGHYFTISREAYTLG